MNLRSGKRLLACVTLAALAATSGCSTTKSVKARSLKTSASATALADCANLTVIAFSVPARKVDAHVGVDFARTVETRLAHDFGPLFSSVAMAPAARGLDHECLIKGNLSKYKPGSRFARAMLIGLGAASLEGTVTVEDAASGQSLLNAPFDKLWAWGGVIGASKDMDDMLDEASASIAATVAHAKGWNGDATKM